MTIAWRTDNQLSYTVLSAIGCPLKHIKEFNSVLHCTEANIFYGLLRGASRAMMLLDDRGGNYYYIDNGYFDAKYIDDKKLKDTSGTYRIVKNATHHEYDGEGINIYSAIKWVLLLPPSPYSAMHHSTTPEDWIQQSIEQITKIYGDVRFIIRDKNSDKPLEEDIKATDAVWSFNSMATIKAIEMGKPVNDTNAMFNKDRFAVYDYQKVREFYESRQFTLEQFKDFEWL